MSEDLKACRHTPPSKAVEAVALTDDKIAEIAVAQGHAVSMSPDAEYENNVLWFNGSLIPFAHAILASAVPEGVVMVPKDVASNLRKFLDAAAGEGFELAGVDAADLYTTLFPWPPGVDAMVEAARQGGKAP